MLLNQSFFSLSWFQNQHSLLCFIFACTLRFLVFLFFFTFPSCTTARSSQSFCTWWLKWGNPMPEEKCKQARELLGPRAPHLFFLGSLADVFKWEKLGCKCSFPVKTGFPFEEYFVWETNCPFPKLTLPKKQSAESGAPPPPRHCWGISCINGTWEKLGLGFR